MNSTTSKSSFLRSVVEEIKFHLVGTGYNYEPKLKPSETKPGRITPKHQKEITKKMQKNQKEWEKKHPN